MGACGDSLLVLLDLGQEPRLESGIGAAAQTGQLAQVGPAELDDPTVPVGILIDERGVVVERLVGRDDLAADRRVEPADPLARLDRADGLALLDLAAGPRQADEGDLLGRGLGIVAQPERDDVAFGARILVMVVVIQ
jgi:hypothetical protein